MTEITEHLKAAVAERYLIERELGAGGMATVYLAHDVKHDRKVALKVLRPELAAVLGAERFVQEIKTTAALQHPHILPLFDSGTAGEREGGRQFLYYVMPYIEGETLRDMLNRETQLGIEEAVKITTEVADALDYAHRHGVIHRDIKPENILLHDGRPMVADFGIALAVSAAAGGRMTETGLSLGTPHYMSPEQATADKDLTNRSDLYSLGCVLFEMLTGEPPHTGASAQAIVMKIVMDEARPVTDLRKSVPPHVAAATAKALAKLPADRFHGAAEFAEALKTPGFMTAADTQVTAATARRTVPRVAWAGWLAAALLAVIAGWQLLRPSPSEPVSRYSVSLAADQGLVPARGSRIALSPDGSRMVYIGPGEGGRQLWVRRRDELTATPLPGTETATHVFFSPDGSRVGFIVDAQRVLIVSLAGGPPVTAADSGAGLDGATWSADGYIYYDAFTGGGTVGLARVPAAGGSAELVTTVDTAAGESDHIWPTALPDGRGVLFMISRGGDVPSADIAVVDPSTGMQRVLVRGVAARYVRSGHLVYLTADGTLMAAPFDLGKLVISGDAVALAGGVAIHPFGSADLTVSNEGTLVYVTGAQQTDPAEIVWVTPTGAVEPVDPSWVGDFRTLAISPDGRKLAVSTFQNGEEQVWVKDLPRGPFTKLTFDGTLNYRPAWTPDGRDVTYVESAGGNDLMVKRADGSAAPEVLLHVDAAMQEGFWSRRGDWIVYRVTPRDIFARSANGDTVTVIATQFEERAPALSPDGRWIAYQSDASGRYEVYVRPFPAASTAQWQVSTNGGTLPRWAPDGRTLYYESPSEMVAVQVVPGITFATGERRSLFPLDTFVGSEGSYDVTPDGSRFVMIRNRGSGDDAELIVVENVFQELKAKVGAR